MWINKYRPKRIEDMVLNQEIKDYFISFRGKNHMPSQLFLGRPGIGKTTLAKLIVSDVLKCQHLYINASSENGIDTIRNKILGFASTQAIDGACKVIILDEGDGLTPQAQNALRNELEGHDEGVCYIITGNHKHKIQEPILSRCGGCIHKMDFSINQYVAHILTNVVKKEGIKFAKGSDPMKFLKPLYPDFRKAYHSFQSMVVDGCIDLTTKQNVEYGGFYEKLWGLLKNSKKLHEIRKYVIENESEFSGDYQKFGIDVFNYICEECGKVSYKTKSMCLMALNDALRAHNTVMDAEINMFSALIAISNQLKSENYEEEDEGEREMDQSVE